MLNTHRILSALRRPKILIRAARLGLADYNRDADLRYIARTQKTPRPEEALETLISQEMDLETSRKDGDARYSVHQHIRVLTALLAEARLPGLT